jgi:hypothetical protein
VEGRFSPGAIVGHFKTFHLFVEKVIKMSIYTIESDRSIRFGSDGSIEILGLEFRSTFGPSSVTVPEGAVIMVTDSSLLKCCPSEMILDDINSCFRTSARLFRTLDREADRIIFSVKLGRPIHNQRKFLRSIRSKLNGIEHRTLTYLRRIEDDRRLGELMAEIQ